jgi:hypothetical protein
VVEHIQEATMQKGQWKKDKKRIPKLQTVGGFRLVRVFSAAHNVHRLQVYCKRLQRGMDCKPGAGRFKLFLRRRRRQQGARPGEVFRPGHHYPGQNEATGTRPGAQHSGA